MALIIVHSCEELLTALERVTPSRITVKGRLTGLPTLHLEPGWQIQGAENACLEFAADSDGLCLTNDNRVAGLKLLASHDKRAVFNSRTVGHMGRLELVDLTVEGQVQIVASDSVQGGTIEATNVFVRRADTRTRAEGARGNGVEIMQGGLTVWNQQPDPGSVLSTRLRRIRVGSSAAPVLGGGVFLSGYSAEGGGSLRVDELQVEAAYVDSGLAPGTTSRVGTAVFVSYGAIAPQVNTSGPVETLGPNCVALDNWGEVGVWVSGADVRSHGPSAVAIVNAGKLGALRVEGVLETFGEGARGLSNYAAAGAVHLRSVVTHGNAATAIHLTQSLDQLTVSEGITTFGQSGESLVKGVMQRMHADGLEIEPGAHIGRCSIGGSILVHGAGASALRLLVVLVHRPEIA